MREREKRFLDRLPLEKRLNTMTFIIIIPLTVLVIYLMATVVKFCNAYNQSIVNITDVNNSMAYFREDLDYTMYRIAIGTMTYQDIHDMPEEDRPYGWEQIKDPHEMINSTRKVYGPRTMGTGAGLPGSSTAWTSWRTGSMRLKTTFPTAVMTRTCSFWKWESIC